MAADVVLVPGLWLDASSWDQVSSHLESADLRVSALTLPGMRSGDDPAGVGLAEHVSAVVTAVDAAQDQVVLVGHSAACGVVWAAADARPGRVTRVVMVAGFPTADGDRIAPWFDPVDGVVPLPDLDELDEADLRDLTDEQLAQFRARALPVPGAVVTDPQRLSDERRYDVPVTAVATEYRADDLRGWVEAGEAPVAELARVRDVTYVDLPTGHWPQWTKPAELAAVIVAAAGG